MHFHTIHYPKDEIKHRDTAEWWYFNGFLQSKIGQFAYMHTLFRIDLRNAEYLKLLPLHKKIFNDFYFAHSMLLNLKTNELKTEIKYHVTPTKESFKQDLLFFEYDNCELLEKPIFNYFLKNSFVELNLHNKKKPLLENKKGIIKNNKYYTYYYSLTNLHTVGAIKWKNKLIKVKGKSWHDHQWMNNMQPDVKWDWFSVQLNNNEEMVVNRMKSSNENNWIIYATMIDKKQKQKTTHNIIFKPQKTIKLKRMEYPIYWIIELPDWKIKLDIKAMHKSQQMDYKLLKYWEGPTKIICTQNKKKIKGLGFLEMVH
ncbi:MAG: hypothetical protein COT14_02260 [Candidatus Diapherotrites archaeon CG08_land_8_20_14_0_20_30_16]|nr:MAG: hypothetical protein COT14_02260 [Candidatus Diapherotrites archaeon CG08_land_8_20_14_0_20_30_16]